MPTSATTVCKLIAAGAAMAAALAVTGVPAAGAGEPTCVEFFKSNFDADIANHGQHILGDYVTGLGYTDWPLAGQVGSTIGGSGALLPGRSGILQHGASPGASFCNGSSSPTSPPGRG